MGSHQFLIVEDDDATRTFLAHELVADGYQILLAQNRSQALQLLAAHRPALGNINGHTRGLLDAVRDGAGPAGGIDPNTPMIVLTARGDELARVRVFDRGGDDVVTKPFSYPELRGRIAALLRRAYEPRPASVSQLGCLTVDRRGREVRVREQRVELCAKEFELLAADRRTHPRVHPRRAAARRVGLPLAGQDQDARRARRAPDAKARRRRPGAAAGDQRLGVGYRLADSEAGR